MSSGWRRTVTAAVLPSATHLGLRLSKHCSRSGLTRVRLLRVDCCHTGWVRVQLLRVGSGSSSRALKEAVFLIELTLVDPQLIPRIIRTLRLVHSRLMLRRDGFRGEARNLSLRDTTIREERERIARARPLKVAA